jgi:hypothetical protein
MRPLWTQALRFRKAFQQLIVAAAGLLLAAPVFAQGNSPWENAVNVLQQAFTSTIARGLSPNLAAPCLLFHFDCASGLRHGPHRQASATNDKRNGSGEPSGFTGFPLRVGSTRACLLEDQRQTPPREGHQCSQIHSS